MDKSEWVTRHDESLRIVSDELWDAVFKIQTAHNPRREAVKLGIAKKACGHDSAYWLGTLLVCECGANYIGSGKHDFICPAQVANACANDMRFRRNDANEAMFELLSGHLLSDKQIRLGVAHVEKFLKDQAQQEELAGRAASKTVEVKKPDQELAALRKMNLRPAAMAAGLEEIERERAALMARINGKDNARLDRLRKLTTKLSGYRGRLPRPGSGRTKPIGRPGPRP